MEKIITGNLNSSGLKEEYNVIYPDKSENTENNITLNYFRDREIRNKIIETILTENTTTDELSSLIKEIKLDQMRTELEEYLEIIKEHEMFIVEYLLKKGLIDNKKDIQTIKLIFYGFGFSGIDIELLHSIEGYNLNKGSFKFELEKIDDENGKYLLNITVKRLDDGDIIIENMKIEKGKQ